MVEKKENLIKNYFLCQITTKDLKKDKVSEIKEDNTKSRKMIEELDNKEVLMYAFKKKKSIKAIYIFKKEKTEEGRILKIQKELYTKDITKEAKAQLKERLLEELKELVGGQEYQKVDWKDLEVIPQTIEIGGRYNIALSTVFLAIGLIGMLIFDEILIFMIALIFSLTSGAIIRKK